MSLRIISSVLFKFFNTVYVERFFRYTRAHVHGDQRIYNVDQ